MSSQHYADRHPPMPHLMLSLDELSDDLIHNILSFVPCVRSLGRFGATSRRARSLVFESIISDPFFEVMYRQLFDFRGTFFKGGRGQWKSLYRLRKSFEWGMLDAPEKNKPLNTLGIMTPKEESEAILYDNPTYAGDQQYCIGYFGYHALPENGPVMVWGDYNGVRVAPSLEVLWNGAEDPKKKRGIQSPENHSNVSRVKKSLIQSVGERDGGFQVLTVLEGPKSCNGLYIFLGFASGMVSAVNAVLSPGGEYVYTTKSTASAHTSEVTALALLPLDKPCLLSGSVDGKVYAYPRSITGSLDLAVLACSQTNAVFSIGAVRWNNSDMLLCTGLPDGNVKLWQALSVSSQPEESEEAYRFNGCSIYSATSSHGSGVLVTKVLFLHNDSKVLVSGTNAGEIRFWEVSNVRTKLAWGEFGNQPRLELRRAIGLAHSGTIETIKVVGNVLITSGGNDGQIKGWDISSGGLLGGVSVHPGRLHSTQPHAREKSLKSAVVGTLVCHERESLVSLCRDGTIREWSYGEDHYNSLKKVADQTKWRSRKRRRTGTHREHWESKLGNVFESAASAVVEQKQQMIEELSQIVNTSGQENEDEPLHPESIRSEMQRSIIFAAFRHCCEVSKDCTIPCPFIGSDDCIYSDIQTAFDLFSGIPPCSQCQASGHPSYSCRLRLKHDAGLDRVGATYAMGFLRALLRSKKVAPASTVEVSSRVPRTGVTDRWICTGCQLENTHGRVRCRECFRKKATDSETPSATLAAFQPVVEHSDVDTAKRSASIRVWQCYKCAFRNPYSKSKCQGCGKKAGGPILFVNKEDAPEPLINPSMPRATKRRARKASVVGDVVPMGSARNLSRRGERRKKNAVSTEVDMFLNLRMNGIHTPHENDVLYGMHNGAKCHTGNNKFRALVNQQQIYYLDATTAESQFISRAVVRAVRSQIPPGRFLQKDESSGLWYDVGDSAAANKAHKSLWEIRRTKPRPRTMATAETSHAETADSVRLENTETREEDRADSSDSERRQQMGRSESRTVSSRSSSSRKAAAERSTDSIGPAIETTVAEEVDCEPLVEWECHRCTLLNPTNRKTCKVCDAKRKKNRSL